MRIGPLRHRVTIQRNTPAQNSFGEPVASWSALATIWANVLPSSGRENFIASGEQELATITHRVQMRYRNDLTPKMRIVWDGRNLDIESVQDPSGKREYLMVLCREQYTGIVTEPSNADYLLDFSQAEMSMYLGVI